MNAVSPPLAAEIALEPRLTSSYAADLYAKIKAMRGSPINMDASNVTGLGAQCLAVLLAAREAWMSDEMGFEIKNPSSEFNESLTVFGLSTEEFKVRETGDES